MKKIIKNLSAITLFLGLGLRLALAQCDPTQGVCDPTDGATFQSLIAAVANFMFLVSIPIVGIMVIYGAFLMLASAGDPGKIQHGKDVIKWAIIGFIVVVLAQGAAYIIQDLFDTAATP